VTSGAACLGSLTCRGGGAGGVYHSDAASLIRRGLVIPAAAKVEKWRAVDGVTKAIDSRGKDAAAASINKHIRKEGQVIVCAFDDVVAVGAVVVFVLLQFHWTTSCC
jgi:hypothetical protein